MLPARAHRSCPQRRARGGARPADRAGGQHSACRYSRRLGHGRPSPAGRASRVRALSRRRRPAAARRAGGARHRAALHAPGGRHRARAGRPARRHHHADGVGQDALLQRAGAQRDPARPVERARCICSRPRRWRRISWPSCTSCRTSCRGRDELEIGVFTYDGDTPQDARRAIRGRAHVVLSNPDMLHSGILPHHPRWAKLFENLRFVVIDELHAYRGVFGSHLTNVLRRLRRDLPALRVESDVHLLVGDDRQPARAGRGARRAAVRAGVGERRAARREVLPVRQPAGRQPAARHPAVVSGRNAPHRRRSS